MQLCPQCQSNRIKQDHPPTHGYVLVLLGCWLLFVGAFLNPGILATGLGGEVGRMLIFGGALLGYGALHLFKHPNRYCTDCGTRFRKTRGTGAVASAATENQSSRLDAAFAKAEQKLEYEKTGLPSVVKESTSSRSCKLNHNQKIKPLLACLKFKDPKQRETAAQTLRELTGQNLPAEHEPWAQWWEENMDAYKAARREKSQ